MEILSTPLDGVFVLKSKLFDDERGFFLEAYKESLFKEKNLCASWVQDNVSFSHKGVVRGLHFQKDPFAQIKLVRVLAGRAFDVAVDLRKGSKTFGKSYSLELSFNNGLALYIPDGFAHGFQALEDSTVLSYKCSRAYNPSSESGILWNDPGLNIEWPLRSKAICSPKDQKLLSMKEL
ncbi:MAG: dTDP-4-dehydrorhamnose 3,5-epimerase [bacterium]